MTRIARQEPILPEPPVKAKPHVDMELLFSIHPELLEDAHVYVHCHFQNNSDDMLIRIWRTTYLMDTATAARSQLVHAENITYAPVWTMVPAHSQFNFLLIFAGLPKSCQRFDLIEEVAQAGGFHIRNIPRNEQDVYHVNIP